MSDEKAEFPDSYPESDDRTVGYQVARTAIEAAASIVPGAGYALGQIVEHVIGEPLRKRRDEFFTRVGERLNKLEEQGRISSSELSDDEEFVSAVYEATQIYMKTSKEEKRQLLENAIINTALGFNLDDVLRGAFYALIERFSPLHIVVLKMLHDPSASPEYADAAKNVYMSSKDNIVRQVLKMPHHHASGPLERVFSDLNREGLTDGSEKGGMTKDGVMAGSTTLIGAQFLRFISAPAL
ncbi:hypothetical protein [Methylorubrum extorquens]|uniref:hypothetical protein n=1 Tax=Methylorubrum extorquens TaxID=408 RepID=UPI002238BAAF|nr:hypothetical protein [Methylorubrum extorquens]UYW33636.1 hypothetical protein OKB92_06020 [Methylorubrum extorquens]